MSFQTKLLSGDGQGSYTSKSATYTALTTDYVIDGTANTFTITLPTAVGIQGKTFVIKNSGAGTVTIDGAGSETIDGATTVDLSVQYSFRTIMSDGANWKVISS